MLERKTFVSARATPLELLSVKAYAAAQGLSVSELIRQRIIERAVRPVLAAAQAEVQDGQE